MPEPTIVCPHCKQEIKLTESLAAPLIEATRREADERMERQNAHIAQQEKALREQQAELATQREEMDERIASQISQEREKIEADALRRARTVVGDDIAEKAKELATLKELLKKREDKLAEAAKEQAEVARKERELDDRGRELDLTIERRVQASLGDIREAAQRAASEAMQLKVREKEEQISSMARQIEDLQRKAAQGSQQLQGEAQELELESMLAAKFPRDTIEPVAKGEFGGDVLHRVFSSAGQPCGTILWESKRTKSWTDGWLTKLRADQRAAKADLALIVSQALPRDMKVAFDLIDGVWVTEPKCAGAVAVALRESLIALAAARQAGEGQKTKTEMIYDYLTGPRFRQRVEAIVEKFTDMQDDLNRERRTMTKLWAKREEQIRSVIESTSGMYGDLQGIAGRNLQEIEALAMPAIEAPSNGNSAD